MRILYILGDRGIPLASHRGSAVHARSLLDRLARQGHAVTVVARSLEGTGPLPRGVRCLDWPADRVAAGARRRIGAYLERHGSSSQLQREFDTILSAAPATDGIAARIEAGGLERPDVVIERLSLFGTAGIDLARRLGVPFLLEVNAPLTRETRTWRRLELEPLAQAVEDRLVRGADAVLAVSRPLRDWAVEAGAAAGRVHLVENGVDTDRFRPDGPVAAGAARAAGGGFTVGFAGSLKPWHGLEVLLDAVARLNREGNRFRLLLLGTGPMERPLARRARSLGIGADLHLQGEVPHAEVPGWLRACDALAAPYPDLAGFHFCPIKVLEYLAVGRPVVASSIGPIPEWIRDGRDGLLVPPGDPAALAAALHRLAADPDLRRRLGATGPDRVAGRGWSDVARKVAAIAAGCIENHQTRKECAAP